MICNNTAGISHVAQRFIPDPRGLTPLVELLMENMTRGVIYLNNHGILTFINSYAAALLQVRQETVIGKRVDMLPLRTPLYKVLSESCRDNPLEMVVNGRVIVAQSMEIRSGDGIVHGEMTELWDITDERRAKKQWEEFVAMMTHDLRSPLTVMMGYIQGMLCGMYGELEGRLLGALEEVEESGEKLNAMIEEMLDVYRLEVGLLDLNRQSCDMGRILEGCYRDNMRGAREQGVSLLMEPMESLPELTVDSKQFTRVFNNLIGNAIKYTPAAGEVSITAETTGYELRVSVVDTGIGIPPEDLSRIFLKYYRCAGASGFKGTGLGLAISKTIVEAHGGSIEVESAVNMGSRFRVIIPFNAMEEYNV